jgi:predicted AlkP superfamily pyrophosphatase or phosphodiesterase
MKNKTKVVFVLIDALRSDYITKEDSPFLYSFSIKNKYYKNVTQSRSFCERAEIFSGLSPRESGYFTAMGYSPEKSPFRNISILDKLSFIDKIFGKYRYYKALKNRIIRLLFINKKVAMRSYSIPLNFLKYFSLTEDEYDFREEIAFNGKENIFKDCINNGLNIYYDSFTALNFTNSNTDEERLQMVENNIDSKHDLYLTYVGVMDSCAHVYGPDSIERKSELKKLDQRLFNFHKNIISKHKDAKFIFLGDHGMASVKHSVDLGQALNQEAKLCKLKAGKDFIYFLDSTMFRIWYLNENASKILNNKLKSNPIFINNGVFVNKIIAKKEKIPFPDKRYGDLLWMANTGVLVFPDFFHTTNPYKGMHGYDINHFSSKGTCIVSANEFDYCESIKLTDVYQIIKKELNID